MIICSCKGVSKTEIERALKNGAQNIVDIQMATKATTGCGRCKGVVVSMLERSLAKQKQQGQQLRLDF